MREHSDGKKKNVCFILPESKYRMKHYTRFNVFRDYKPRIASYATAILITIQKTKFDKANNEIDKKQFHDDFKQLVTIRCVYVCIFLY